MDKQLIHMMANSLIKKHTNVEQAIRAVTERYQEIKTQKIRHKVHTQSLLRSAGDDHIYNDLLETRMQEYLKLTKESEGCKQVLRVLHSKHRKSR